MLSQTVIAANVRSHRHQHRLIQLAAKVFRIGKALDEAFAF